CLFLAPSFLCPVFAALCFFMSLPPPRSTLFPYTTLFRSRPLCSTHGKARFRDAMTHPLASPETGLSHFTDSAAGAEWVRTLAVLPSFEFFRLSPPTFCRAGGHDGELQSDAQFPFPGRGATGPSFLCTGQS